MTAAEAGRLLELLRDAFPRTKVEDGTADLWLKRLRSLDLATGEQAIASLIDTAKVWPSIASLNVQVQVAREQAIRERRDRERHEQEREFDELDRPPLREIPAARELLERYGQGPPPLDQGDYGQCDDCGRDGARYQLGRVLVCAGCSTKRLLAGVRLVAADDANGEAA